MCARDTGLRETRALAETDVHDNALAEIAVTYCRIDRCFTYPLICVTHPLSLSNILFGSNCLSTCLMIHPRPSRPCVRSMHIGLSCNKRTLDTCSRSLTCAAGGISVQGGYLRFEHVCHWCFSCGVACVSVSSVSSCLLYLSLELSCLCRYCGMSPSLPVCPISMRLGLLLGLCLARRYSDPGGRREIVVKWLEGEVQGPRERRMERTWKAVLKMSSKAETTTLQRKAQRVTVTVQLLQMPPRRPRRLTSRDDLLLPFAVGGLWTGCVYQ